MKLKEHMNQILPDPPVNPREGEWLETQKADDQGFLESQLLMINQELDKPAEDDKPPF